MKKTFSYTGKTALITGASSGLGETFARTLAALGTHVILVARSEEKLKLLAKELNDLYAIRCETIAADLSQSTSIAEITHTIRERGLRVDIIINNAGFGTYGKFDTLSPTRDHEEVMVNVSSVVDITHAFLPEMVARGEGAIINTASIASFMPLPYMPVYGASKAFVLSFSEALWRIYRQRGIRVIALCPGPVETNFFNVAENHNNKKGQIVSPERVVASALRALEKGKSYVIPGVLNHLMVQGIHLIPNTLVTNLVEQVTRPGA